MFSGDVIGVILVVVDVIVVHIVVAVIVGVDGDGFRVGVVGAVTSVGG